MAQPDLLIYWESTAMEMVHTFDAWKKGKADRQEWVEMSELLMTISHEIDERETSAL